MTDLDTLRPEVREAVVAIDGGNGVFVNSDDGIGSAKWKVVRAELLRLAGEVTELRAVCAATYQAAGCYGLPERFKDALSNAATGERIHDVDVDNLCPVDPVEWVERAEKAESELAALKDNHRGLLVGTTHDGRPYGLHGTPESVTAVSDELEELAALKARMRPVARVENGEVRALMDPPDEGKYVAVVVVEE